MRFFNTAGPVRRDIHYCLPPLERINLEEVLTLIEQQKFFVLHAPRQTGKTSCLLALMEYLNKDGRYRALYVNLEAAQAARENVDSAMRAILGEIAGEAGSILDDPYPRKIRQEVLDEQGAHGALGTLLSLWAQNNPKPLVVMMDEIDALVGDTLISVLRQLRAGYAKRPGRFPQSVILCGVRDVRDYRIHSGSEKAMITGGSAFNVKAASLRLGDFSRSEVEVLFGQHTEETGQRFAPDAVETVWELSRGQPWLVNALGYETCFQIREGRDRSRLIAADLIIEARENLIQRRETHLDQLVDKLQEERVRRVVSPILEGTSMVSSVSQDDISYVVDLGLVAKGPAGFFIANPIYGEIIPRELSYITQLNMEPLFQPAWYVDADGRLNVNKLLFAFQEFFREHSEHWVERFQYKEAGPQLLLQAFLQRIVNGGGRIEREYGLGRMRTDLLIIWPVRDGTGQVREKQKGVIELKILHRSLDETISLGLGQTFEYMQRCAAAEGHLVVFDRAPEKSWDEKIFRRDERFREVSITVWGM